MDQVGVIYARFSSHAQREESIEDQLRECHAFAERNGIRIVEEYCDQALTGKTDARPAFQRMVRDSAKGRFSIVITYKVDRFARNRYDSATYKARLKKNGVRVLYAKETIPDGPEGIILESVLEGYAEYYSANLAQNITRGLEGNALNCRTNGVVVLGYKKSDDDHYEIDETTAPIVREIFEKYAAGVKQMEICEELNARGLRTTRGGPFNKNSLVRILKNRKYIGEYHYMDVTVPGGMPAIISVELFEDVQQKLKRGRRAPSKDWSCADFLLTGKLFCGECGEPMVGTSGHGRSGRKYNYYICGAKKRRQGCKKENVAQDWIEEVVLTYTMEVVLQDDTIQEIADGVMDFLAREAADDGVLVSLEARLAEVKTSVKNLMKAIEAGIITKATTERMMELENERVELEDAIAIEKIKEPEIERDQVVFFLEKFRDGDLNDPAFRLRLVEAFVSSVYLWDDGRIDINYNYTGQGSKVSLDQAADIVSKIAGGDGSDLDSSGPFKKYGDTMEEIMSYYIFADVSVDIDQSFAKDNDLRYVPMEYMLGEETFHCTAPESEEMMHNYYEKLRQKITTHTSQITPNHYIELFEPYVKEGAEIIYLSLSSGLSNTYESALMAVQTMEEDYDEVKIEVVDSLAATGGMGLLAELAAANRKSGMGYKENAQWLRDHAKNINHWFKVEDLMYLKRGGRVSAATAIVGTALNIKPVLTIDKEGRLQTIDKKRGNKMAFKTMVDRFNLDFDPSVSKSVYICCGDCMEDAGTLKGMVLECHPEAEVHITMLSPIIGAHTGPDMLSLIYYGGVRPF